MTVEVIEYGRDDIVWPFHTNQPYIRIGRAGKFGHQVHVDPTPGYSHDVEVARETLAQVANAFPIDWPVAVCLLPVEDVGRTNGSTTIDNEYDYDAPMVNNRYPSKQFGTIELSGKRIPPHPAMTRYLVAHEYGHVAEEWLNRQLGNELHDDKLIGFYRQLRGLVKPPAYGAGSWHGAPGEVFANDFRVVVCGIEKEFWPHRGIERPESCWAIRGWWAAQVEHVRASAQEAVRD